MMMLPPMAWMNHFFCLIRLPKFIDAKNDEFISLGHRQVGTDRAKNVGGCRIYLLMRWKRVSGVNGRSNSIVYLRGGLRRNTMRRVIRCLFFTKKQVISLTFQEGSQECQSPLMHLLGEK